MRKSTFSITLFNNEVTIFSFLKSLFSQSQMPDQIILVDLGSTDKTLQCVSKFLKNKSKNFSIKIIEMKNVNQSIGRNEGIKQAKYEIILCSDAGCVLDTQWVKQMLLPFKKESVSVVAGFYKPLTTTVFEQCLATYTCTMEDQVAELSFLPSSRSIAFRKSAWKTVNGYPEHLDTCEDLVFDKKLKNAGFQFFFAKHAVVFWPQRHTFFQAFSQFFHYALQNGRTRKFPLSTFFLFGKYVFILLIISTFASKPYMLLYILSSIIFIYFLWIIGKYYNPINHWKAIFILPVLHITSDIATLTGTSIGFLQSIQIKKILFFLKINIGVCALIIFYCIVVLTGIDWGIPNATHPFSYHMDEWAQSQSIRAVFRHGTPNISGASHGPIFHYFLSGIYLIPFILLHVVNPFIIKSSIEHLDIQQKLFEILRLNTLFYGIFSLILIYKISKEYLKISPLLPGVFFTITPIFLILSNYFKYDIAVVAWILLSILFTFHYAKNPTKKNFILAAIISSLTIATKLSAIPLLLTFIISFFLFTPNFKKRYAWLWTGLFVFLGVFLIAGIPDIYISRKDYYEWFYLNVFYGPKRDMNNFLLGMPTSFFLIVSDYPGIFGHVFYIIFSGSIFFYIFSFVQTLWKKNFKKINKKTFYLFLSFLIFVISVIPLNIGAGNNRALVFLPFFAFISALMLEKLWHFLRKPYRIIVIAVLTLGILFQTFESLTWVSTRFGVDPRDASSKWILKNIPKGSVLGVENVPIFQFVPNSTLMELYEKEHNPTFSTLYTYQIIDAKSLQLPPTVIASNVDVSTVYLRKSPKKDLGIRLKKEGYHQKAIFTPNFKYFLLFNNLKVFYFSALLSSPVSLSIFTK